MTTTQPPEVKASNSTALPTVTAATLHAMRDRVTLVDVREPGEYRGDHIPGAISRPLSTFKPAQVMTEGDRPVVLYCRTSQRSGRALQQLLTAGYTASHLQGGLLAWQAAGYPVEVNPRAPISLMRQVQIVAGTLVFMGTVLGAFVSPAWLLLSGCVGAGLVFAGVTNTCALGLLLAKLPYNR